MYYRIRTWLRVQKLFDFPLATETYISSTHFRSKSFPEKLQRATQRMIIHNHTVVVSIGYYIRFMARHQYRPKAQNCCARFLNLCIYYVRTSIIIILNLQRIQNRKYDRRCVHPEFNLSHCSYLTMPSRERVTTTITEGDS